MLDLQTLTFKVDTSELKEADTLLGKLATTVQSLNKPLEKTALASEKLAKAQAQTAEASAKAATAQAKQATAEANAAKAKERTTAALNKQAEATAKAAKKQEDLLASQIRTRDLIADGYTRGEANILKYAERLGYAEDKLNDLKSVLGDIGKLVSDPFDSAIGSVRSITKEFDSLVVRSNLVSQGIELSSKQLREYSKIAGEVSVAVKRLGFETNNLGKFEGKGLELYNKMLKDQQTRYLDVQKGVAEYRAKEKELAQQHRDTAAAKKFLIKEDERMLSVIEQVNTAQGVSTSTSERVATATHKYAMALRNAGVAGDEAKKKLDNYKATLNQVEAIEEKRRMDRLSRSLAPQISDVVVGLGSGQSLMTVMLQQGLQVRDLIGQSQVDVKNLGTAFRQASADMVSSISGTAKALGSLFVGGLVSAGKAVAEFGTLGLFNVEKMNEQLKNSPKLLMAVNAALGLIGTGVGAIVVAIGLLVAGFVAAIKENNALSASIAKTGATMGLTTESAYAYAVSMNAVGVSTGKALTAITAMADAGVFTTNEIQKLTLSAVNMEKYLGVSIEESIKSFAKLKKDPVDALFELAKSTGRVSMEALDAAIAAEQVGDTAKAAAIAVREGVRVQEESIEVAKKSYNSWGLTLIAVKSRFEELWDAAKGVSRTDPAKEIEDQIKKLQSRVAQNQKSPLAFLFSSGDEKVQIENLKEQLRVMTQQNKTLEEQKEFKKLIQDITDKTRKAEEDALKKSVKTQREIDDLENKKAKADEDQLVRINKYIDVLKERKKKEEESEKDKTKKTEEETYYARILNQVNDLLADRVAEELNLTKAQELRLKLINDPTWTKLTVKEKASIEAILDQAHATELATDASSAAAKQQEFLNKILDKAADYTKSYSDDLRKLMNIFDDDSESFAKFNAALEAQQPIFKKNAEEAKKLAEEIRKLQAEIGAQTGALDERDALMGKTKKEREEIKRTFDYRNKLAKIQSDREAALAKVAPENEKRYLADVLEDKRRLNEEYDELVKLADRERAIAAAEEFDKAFQEIKDGVSDSIATALFEGGKQGRKKLRDVIEQALRKPIVVAIEAEVNVLMNEMLGMFRQLMSSMGGNSSGGSNASGWLGMLGQGASALGGMLGDNTAGRWLGNLGTLMKGGTNGFVSELAGTVKSWLGMGVTGTGAGAGAGITGSALSTFTGSTAPAMTGATATGAATTGGSASSAMAAAWPLAVIAGMFMSSDAYKQGFNEDNGGLVTKITGLQMTTNVLRSLGLDGKTANILSGASLASKVFGRADPRVTSSGIQGTLGAGGSSTAMFADVLEKGGLFRSDKRYTNLSDTPKELTNLLNEGAAATLKAAQEYGKALNLPVETLGEVKEDFRITFTDNQEENLKALQDVMTKYGTAVFDKFKESVKDFAVYGEDTATTVGRLVTNLTTTNAIFEELGLTLFETSVSGAGAASEFIKVFGSLDEFGNAARIYYDKFYTAQEKQKTGIDALSKEFAKFNVIIPDSREGFRSLVEAADKAGNKELLANILKLAPAFDALIEPLEEVQQVVVKMEDILSQVDSMGGSLLDPGMFRDFQLNRVIDSFAAAGVKVSREMLEGTTRTEAAAIALDLYNSKQYEVLQVLLNSIPVLEQNIVGWNDLQLVIMRTPEEIAKNLAALKAEGRSLNAELLKAQGKTAEWKAELRLLAIEGLTAAEVAEWDRNQAIKDTIEALNKAKEAEERIKQERLTLEGRLLQLQGNTAELRRRELAVLDPSNRSLQLYIWALEDAAVAQEKVTRAVIEGIQQQLTVANEALQEAEAAVAEAEGRISSIREQAKNDYLNAVQAEAQIQEQIAELARRTAEEQLEAQRQIAEGYRDLAKSLLDYVRGVVETPKQSFGRVLAAAMGGDQEAMQNLPEAATSAIDLARSTSVDALEFRRQQAKILADVLKAQKLAESLGRNVPGTPQETEAERLQKELLLAQQKVAEALAVANAVNADIATPLGLIAQYQQALVDLAAAEAARDAAANEVGRLEALLKLIEENTKDTVDGISTLSEDIAAALESVKIDVDGVVNLIANSTGLEDWVKNLLTQTTTDIFRTVVFAANQENLPDDLKMLAINTSSELLKTVKFIVGAELPEELMLLANTSVSTMTKTVEFIVGSGLPNDLKEIALMQSNTMVKTVQAVLASDTTDAIKALVLNGTGDYLATVKAIASPTLSNELKNVLFNQVGDYVTTIKAVVDSSVTPENKQLLLTGNSTVNKSVQLQAVMNSVLTDDQKKVLAQASENVTKTISASVQTGVLTEDQKNVLAQENENVNKVVNALVNDSSLTAEQKKYLNLISGSTSSTVTLQGSVTFDPSQPLMSIFQAILNTNKILVEANRLTLMQLTGGTVTTDPNSGSLWYTNPAPTKTGTARPVGGAGFTGTYMLLFDSANYLEEIRDVLKASGGLLVKFARGASAGVDVYAKGGVFTNGIVQDPTMFNNSMMGEAGPEAIIPLTRMADGSLGVRTFESSNDDSGDDLEKAQLLRTLIVEVQNLRAEVRADVGHNAKTARILDRVTRNGEVMLTEEQPVV